MKKISVIAIFLLIATNIWAQSTKKINFQAVLIGKKVVLRDASNALAKNRTLGIKISLLKGSATGAPVYVETQTAKSNTSGLISLEIGSGTVVSGTFNTVDWADGPYFVKTETDPAGGTSYIITSTNQLMSVPYALYAETSGSVKGAKDAANLVENLATSYIGQKKAVFIAMGQSNNAGSGTSVGAFASTTALTNVFGLKKGVTGDAITWSAYQSNQDFNLGTDNIANKAAIANVFAKKWQNHIDAGNAKKLPNLYIINVGSGSSGFEGGTLNPKAWEIGKGKDYLKIQDVLTKALENLSADGSLPVIVGVDWNQWEGDVEATSADPTSVLRYEKNLTKFINDVGYWANNDNIQWWLKKPVSNFGKSYSQVNGYDRTDAVIEQIENIVKRKPNVHLIDPSKSGATLFQSDNVHYTNATQYYFAETIFQEIIGGEMGVFYISPSRTTGTNTPQTIATKEFNLVKEATYKSLGILWSNGTGMGDNDFVVYEDPSHNTVAQEISSLELGASTKKLYVIAKQTNANGSKTPYVLGWELNLNLQSDGTVKVHVVNAYAKNNLNTKGTSFNAVKSTRNIRERASFRNIDITTFNRFLVANSLSDKLAKKEDTLPTGSANQVLSLATDGKTKVWKTPAGTNDLNIPFTSNDVAVFFSLGQSNAYGHGQAIGADAFTALTNVFGLSKANHPAATSTITWSNYASNVNFNLGASSTVGLSGIGNLFAKKWQAHIDAGNALNLPDLYIINISTGGRAFEGSNAVNGWTINSGPLFKTAEGIIPRALEQLIESGKLPKIVGFHWNQWEGDAADANTATRDATVARYEKNLTLFIRYMEKWTNSNNLPTYLYKPVSTSAGSTIRRGIVKTGIENIVQRSPHVKLMDASKYPNFSVGIFSDGVHYKKEVHQWFTDVQFKAIEDGNKGVIYTTPLKAAGLIEQADLVDYPQKDEIATIVASSAVFEFIRPTTFTTLVNDWGGFSGTRDDDYAIYADPAVKGATNEISSIGVSKDKVTTVYILGLQKKTDGSFQGNYIIGNQVELKLKADGSLEAKKVAGRAANYSGSSKYAMSYNEVTNLIEANNLPAILNWSTITAKADLAPSYTIGLHPELGGYVFRVSLNGKHGLVAETQDQGALLNWYSAPNAISNTANHSTNGNKFSDWRMPTKFELNELYLKKTAIGGFGTENYWSSSLNNSPTAIWRQDFTNGSTNSTTPTSTSKVRAIRAF